MSVIDTLTQRDEAFALLNKEAKRRFEHALAD